MMKTRRRVTKKQSSPAKKRKTTRIKRKTIKRRRVNQKGDGIFSILYKRSCSKMNASYINFTSSYLSWIPRTDENDDDTVVKATAFLSLAMVSMLLFVILLGSFQRQLLNHQRRVSRIVYKEVNNKNGTVVHETQL